MALGTIVVAQLISTTWSKKSRGQPLATKRNSVPEHLALPEIATQRGHGCVVHRVDYGEINAYATSVSDMVESSGVFLESRPRRHFESMPDVW